jgi:hypothetical protein
MGRIVCDSLSVDFGSRELGDGGDGGERAWALWRPAPAKKGRQVLERMRLRVTSNGRQLSETRAEEVGFARFFHNPRVSVEEILATAGARTGEAAAGRHVLLIEDSSEINYQAKAGRKRGLGTVGNGTDVGLFVHPALAIDGTDGTVLGLAGATIWQRHAIKQADYQELAIEAKESYRWLKTIAQARPWLDRAALVTVIADREADIYEMLARVPDARTHLLIRANHDRALCLAEGGHGGRLFAMLSGQPEAGQDSFELPARRGRAARRVALAVRFKAVRLRQPVRGADRGDPPFVSINAIEVREIDPPAEEEAVHWRLLTTHPVATVADALRIVMLYRWRWTIEQLFRTMKSQAIDIEASFIEDAGALERLAAAALVAATTVMQLVHARDEAGQAVPAARVFTPDQLATLHALTPQLEGRTAKQKNAHPRDTLAWAAWHIARLGGWKGYRSERPPGPITFSRGLERFEAIAYGVAMAQRIPR